MEKRVISLAFFRVFEESLYTLRSFSHHLKDRKEESNHPESNRADHRRDE
jgi:hypothetical protein